MNNNLIENNNQLTTQVFGEYNSEIFTNSLTKNTKRAYIRDIKDFFDVSDLSHITLEQIKSVNVSSAMQFRDKLIKYGYEGSSINRKLTSMSCLYAFLCRKEIGIMDYNPFSSDEGLNRIRTAKNYSNTRCLTMEEVKEMIRSITSKNPLLQLRDTIIITALLSTGTRREELPPIRLRHIKKNQGKNVIEIKGKGNKERLIVISDSLKVLIDKYVEMRGLNYRDNGDAFLLTSHTSNADFHGSDKQLSTQTIYNVVKKYADLSGIGVEDVSPHCLRHTFVTEAIKLGISERDTADMVGHSSTSTTRRYTHANRVIQNSPADILSNQLFEV